ncbi:MAG: hypothetical protein KAS04_01255 [Candidatus Aenigmarchaeota archaeon]|nr:hypothetical protein [Candidatus Aenigmarchaeota archaeon]
MLRNFTTGKTKFVQIKVSAPDGRFNTDALKGGIDLKTAMFEAKKYPKEMTIDIFDSKV